MSGSNPKVVTAGSIARYGAQVAVSVIIPAYNVEATIERTLESVLRQTFTDYEIIVVNDGSTDKTPEILKKYAGAIRIIQQENGGLASARNSGARHASGKYLAFLDADDVWVPWKLAVTVPILESNQECVLIYSDAFLILPNGQLSADTYLPAGQDHPPSLAELLSCAWNMAPSGYLIRRSTFDEVGKFFEPFRAGYCEDCDLLVRLRERGTFYLYPECLFYYQKSTPQKNAEKRISWYARFSNGRDKSDMLALYVENYELLAQRLAERYGKAARGLVRSIRGLQTNFIVQLGLYACARADYSTARTCYRFALRYRAFTGKILLRLFWLYLPNGLTRRLSCLLSESTLKALNGHAQGLAEHGENSGNI